MTVFITICTCCNNNEGNIIKEIKVGLHNDNELKIQLDVVTNSKANVYAEYWPDSNRSEGKMISLISKNATTHSLILCNIMPQTKYSYQVITIKDGVKNTGNVYSFQSPILPLWLQDQFKASHDSQHVIPVDFKNGFMLLNKRYAPGVAFMVDYEGRVRWYHMVGKGEGFKVVHFTKDKTILSILGTNDEPTSYGSEIMEINLLGDTVLYLKKGEGDFNETIHHEILRDDKKELVTLSVVPKVMDLRAVGGNEKDTINGDGILIMDRKGKQIWKWSVFDVLDPLKDPHILKTKKDWLHANSLNYDLDSNFIISFYNLGQIWKVDAHTGKVIWKVGKGGTIKLPADCYFDQSHDAHLNDHGDLMFFDNGVDKRQSEVFALKLSEKENTGTASLHFKLPKEVYNGRMGSAYMVNDTSILCCCSKRHIVVLADRKGVLLWTMETAMPSYRAEFITKDQVAPWLKP
jgi:arylsulfate sulfotransferase